MTDEKKPVNKSKGEPARLIVPIKSFEYAETVQDILFSNKELHFQAIYFLHVIENAALDAPLYTHAEAINRMSKQDRKIIEARAFLDEIVKRTSSFMQTDVRSDVLIADDIAECIIKQAEQWRCNIAILLADTSSFSDGWFTTSVLKTVLKKAPLDLRVHVIRPAAGEGLSFGLKLR